MTNQTSNQLALIRKDTVDIVAEKVRHFQEKGELHLPANYSASNALKSAWLVLQETVDKSGKPALEVCTKNSIANSLLDMTVQGLNPAKKQCYFLVYGNKLVCMRSYHGAVAVTKSLCGAKDVFAQVIWKDDEFEYSIDQGNKKVTLHKQKLSNVGKDPQGAYCTIILPDGSEYTDIMTMEQIRKSWTKSKMNPNDSKSTHSQFTEEMIKRTVTNRACKKYINSSSDDAILKEHFNRADEVVDEAEFESEVNENANGAIIDIGTGEVVDAEFDSRESNEPPQEEPEDPELEKEAAGGPGF